MEGRRVSPELRAALRLVLKAYPPGSIAPMLREHALELLAGSTAEPESNGKPERMLTAEEVTPLLHTTVRWVYSHADQLGGKRLSRRCLRFPEAVIRRRIERRQQ